MATSLPTAPSGQTDYNSTDWSQGYASVVDAMLEYVPDLTWPISIRTYNRMRWDPQLKAVMSAYTLPIRRAVWSVDGKDCNPAVTAEVADNLGLPILGVDDSTPTTKGYRRRGFQFSNHLRLALLDLTFGHMPFSRWYDVSSGRARIAGVVERMPQTIEQIHLVQDGTGAIDYVEQGISTTDRASNRIKANELVWYAHEKEGSAWTGQSLLRASYPAWLIKHELWRVHATSIRRFGMGVPEVQAPPGAQPNQIVEASRLAAGIRAGNTSGVGLPNGFTYNLKGMTGSVPDALAFINYLDKQMTRATLTSLLDMTDTTHGSRALGETFMDLLLLSLQSIADEHAEQATDQLVVPLVDANWGEDEPSPRIVCGDVGSQHEVTAQTLQLLVSSGALEPDPSLDQYVRDQYKLPDRTTPWVAPHSVPDPMGTFPDGANAPAQDPSVVPGDTPAEIAAAARTDFQGACIMAMVEPDEAVKLAVDGGEPPESMHVTLGFLDKPADEYDQATRERLDAALSAVYAGPITADAFAVAAFNADNAPDDEHPPCTVLLVQSQALADLHDSVSDVLDAVTGVESSTTFPIWTPHVTLGYGILPADVPPGRLGTITFDRLVISWAGQHVDLSTAA